MTTIEANRRFRARPREPIIRQQDDKGNKLKFSLCPTEILSCDGEYDGKPMKGFFVVRSISQEEKSRSIKIEMVSIHDARITNEIKKSHQWITKSPNELRKCQAKKVIVSPLGEVSKTND